MRSRRSISALCTTLACLVHNCAATSLADTWKAYLHAPPPEAVALVNDLRAYADGALKRAPALAGLSTTFDVVVSGGGDYDAYAMGAFMVFDRLPGVATPRFAGASAGGMLPFEWLLKGEEETLATHLAYGILTRDFPGHFLGPLAAWQQDSDWRTLAEVQQAKYAAEIDSGERLNGRAFLALTCFNPWKHLVVVSNYTTQKNQARDAFMATGTAVQWYDGELCSDGGSASGPKMTPLFQDHARQQLVIDLMSTGYPFEMVYKIVLDKYVELVKRGIDDTIGFLSGLRKPAPLSWCPVGADVSDNTCRSAPSEGAVAAAEIHA